MYRGKSIICKSTMNVTITGVSSFLITTVFTPSSRQVAAHLEDCVGSQQECIAMLSTELHTVQTHLLQQADVCQVPHLPVVNVWPCGSMLCADAWCPRRQSKPFGT